MISKEIIVFAEQESNNWRDGSLEAIHEGSLIAARVEGVLSVVCVGELSDHHISILEKYDVHNLISVNHNLLITYSTDGYVSTFAQFVKQRQPYMVIANATQISNDFLPRLAARQKCPFVSNCVRISIDDQEKPILIKPTHYGKFYTTITCEQTPIITTLISGSIGIGNPNGQTQIRVETFTPVIYPLEIRTTLVSRRKGNPKTMDVREARIVVGAGRGADDPGIRQMVEKLGVLLGSPVAGTRALLDLGLLSRDRMVGQTGKTIKPELYIALGISGAYYHMQGIDPSSQILAINIDRKAPIFSYCKLGVVAELSQVLHRLIVEIENCFK